VLVGQAKMSHLSPTEISCQVKSEDKRYIVVDVVIFVLPTEVRVVYHVLQSNLAVPSAQTLAPDRKSLPARIAQSILVGPHPCRLDGALGNLDPSNLLALSFRYQASSVSGFATAANSSKAFRPSRWAISANVAFSPSESSSRPLI
jgi:hypothetical protein